MNKLLADAFKNRFKMDKEDAIALAKTVENIFNGNKEIEDMSIDKYARALFYELQKERFLKLRREEIKEKGRQIRKYFWSFNNEMIKKIAFEKTVEDCYAVYKKIPKEAWVNHTYCS
jgi:hypothetical protein